MSRLIDLCDDGVLDPMMAVKMCVKWMTNDEEAEMLEANGFNEESDDD